MLRKISTPSPISQTDDDISLPQIANLMAEILGLHIQTQQQKAFKKIIQDRAKVLNLSLNDYHQYLTTNKRLLLKDKEWQELIPLLTVPESYLFRDQGQFWLLKNQILPELIERKRWLHSNRSVPNQKPELRIWSAGCSTGEEAYSLAILLKELIPDQQAWDILILGTDVNPTVIEIAQQGIYSDWSFRATQPEFKNRYFRPHQKNWQIEDQIQKMVTFQAGNLVQDTYPNPMSNIHDLDLILCRNVFIYFSFHAITPVLQKFYHSLTPGGYLLTGHTELHGQSIEPFQTRVFLQSTVYQKEFATFDQTTPLKLPSNLEDSTLTASKTSSSSFSPISTSDKVQEDSEQILLSKAQEMLKSKDYVNAIQVAEQLISLNPTHFTSYCLAAEAYANLGHYINAKNLCQQALQINSLAVEPCYLLAQLAEEQGDIEQAKSLLRRIIYLAPTSIPAYLELSSIYEKEGNRSQVKKNWNSLLQVLEGLPQEQLISVTDQQTVADLKSYVSSHKY